MKLNKSMNSNIYYCFGNKDDSLFLLKRGDVHVLLGNEAIPQGRFVMADQTHSTVIKVVEESDLGAGFLANKQAIPIVDGFISSLPNTFIVIKGADCTPILIYAKNKNVVGACHSGREGTKNGIVKTLIKKLITEFNVSIEDLVVMIGPAISGSKYQVSEDIFNEFLATTKIEQDYRNIDMQKVIIHDVMGMGINMEQIVMNDKCTYSNHNYFSYRRDKTKDRQLSIIGIVDGKIFK